MGLQIDETTSALVTGISEKLTAAESELATLRQQLANCEASIAELQGDNERLRRECDGARADTERLRDALERRWYVRAAIDPRTSWNWCVVSFGGDIIATGGTRAAALDAAIAVEGGE